MELWELALDSGTLGVQRVHDPARDPAFHVAGKTREGIVNDVHQSQLTTAIAHPLDRPIQAGSARPAAIYRHQDSFVHGPSSSTSIAEKIPSSTIAAQ
jgi:hypothetical protein